MSNRAVRVALEVAASLAAAVGVYWTLGRMLESLATLFSSPSQAGQALATLMTFLSPGYLGPLVVIALASSFFALLSHYRGDHDEPPPEANARRPGPRRRSWPRGGTKERSRPATGSAEAGHGRQLERAAGNDVEIAQEADPAAHPALPRP